MTASVSRQPQRDAPVWSPAPRRDDAGLQRLAPLGAPVLVLPPAPGGTGPRAATSPGVRAGWDALTPRELEVVGLVTLGATNQQVARRLRLSPHTVSAHLRHVFDKLGVSSRVELTRLAVAREHGWPSAGTRNAAEGS